MKGKFTFSCVLTLVNYNYEIDIVTGFFLEHIFKKKIFWLRILPGTAVSCNVLSISLEQKKYAHKLDYLLVSAKLISSLGLTPWY